MRQARAAQLRTTTAVITVLILAGTAAACGKASSSGSKGITIGIALPNKSLDRYVIEGNAMVKQFAAKGYKADLRYGNNDINAQISQIHNMIALGDKVLLISAIDGESLGEVLLEARDAHVKVIAYDRLILGSRDVSCYASFDNYKVGQLQAQYIVDKLRLKKGKGPFNMELFAGSPDDNNTQYFFNGSLDILQPYIDNGQLVIGSGQKRLSQVNTLNWDGAIAGARMKDLLATSYNSERLDAILSPDDAISQGIIATLKAFGYGTLAKPFPVITGQDAEAASVKSIIAGEQSETVYKDTRKLAGVAVQMSVDILNGRKPQINDTKQYDNGNGVVPSYLLPPVSVDKSNYKRELLDSGYLTAAELK
ncbi:multiple monosaccharide ABC transporter substrate-binding protein [Actinacidiphila oryziradicis]|uniref:multiple monosaccharide ABC transporter substrate-binding protein n=1 Tax=Actinacidiphila oryziradicis TaxID=2571141 RepID=UPI0023F53CA7|nr:multiple monosaccharide ABC transporter substrate-binding protein [Actinacidiphila oryziradicis]MCW2874336.1 sbpA [Actinacidiphila oryziradicis]